MRRSRSFPYELGSVAAARHFAIEALGDQPPDAIEAVKLMVSELATNCIRHACRGFDLSVALTGGQIRVEVTDRAAGAPRMRSPGPADPTGRGLQIVDMLSSAWGVERVAASGKTVWFTYMAPG